MSSSDREPVLAAAMAVPEFKVYFRICVDHRNCDGPGMGPDLAIVISRHSEAVVKGHHLFFAGRRLIDGPCVTDICGMG